MLVDRTRKEFADGDIAKIAEVYHAWREGKDYKDVPGFCKATKLEDSIPIAKTAMVKKQTRKTSGGRNFMCPRLFDASFRLPRKLWRPDLPATLEALDKARATLRRTR